MGDIVTGDDSRELAIMADVSFGVGDINKAMLWFTVRTLHGSALQRLTVNQAEEMIQRHQVTDIRKLEGHPCIVTRPDRSLIKFVDLFKP